MSLSRDPGRDRPADAGRERRALLALSPEPLSRDPARDRPPAEEGRGVLGGVGPDAAMSSRELGRDAERDPGCEEALRPPAKAKAADRKMKLLPPPPPPILLLFSTSISRDVGRDPVLDPDLEPGRDPDRDPGRDPDRDPGRQLAAGEPLRGVEGGRGTNICT